MKERRVWLAGVLGAIEGGLGFLYVGRPGWAIAWLVLPFVAVAMIAWSRMIFHVWGMALLPVFAVGFWLTGVVLPILIARRTGTVELRRWQRWYIYLGFWVVAAAIGAAEREWRGPLLGFETFRIPSMSMKDTLLPGDFILTDDWAYTSGNVPKRGDIVVYRAGNGPSDTFVKRVMGLPGELLEIKQGVLYINGSPIGEPYVAPGNNLHTMQQELRYQVPQGAFYVLGDARDSSNDSRYMGPVVASDILGRGEVIWMSWDSKAGIRSDRIGMRLH